MFDITNKTTGSYSKDSIRSMNKVTAYATVTASNAASINAAKNKSTNTQPRTPQPNMQPTNRNVQPSITHSAVSNKPMPKLENTISKGMKHPINGKKLKVGIGWNVTDPRCDVDVSAFFLGDGDKVPSDDWFVFYGQTKSPDGSTEYITAENADRKHFDIDLDRLSPQIKKIVFVVTIDEAMKKGLDFGMLKDVYIRITDQQGKEILSFVLKEHYSGLTSMMLGEIYEYKGSFKFNAIGNGVARDLAGLCGFYGVEIE